MSATDEQSVHLSKVLDCIGYNRHMVEVRKDNRMVLEHLIENMQVTSLFPGPAVIAGSQGEGLGKHYTDDYDLLYFNPDIICLSEVPVSTDVPIVFITHGAQPGYCLLELHSGQDCLKNGLISESLIKYRGQVLLRSKRFRELCHLLSNSDADSSTSSQITGPASTRIIKSIGCSRDYVSTLSCKCPAIMEQFLKRPQKYIWPSSSCRKEIRKMRANLVATGMKGSSTEDLEWRYCFNEIEKLLVNNLNDTLLKLYVVLKLINKDILDKKGFTLSSFMWKNVVFWMVEDHEQTYYRPENLYKLVIECLKRMKLAARENNLPYYMIPERNLFKEKVNTSDISRLQKTLSDLIQQGQTITINSTRLGKFMQLNPDELRLFDKKAYWFEMVTEEMVIYVFITDQISEIRGGLSSEDISNILGSLAQFLNFIIIMSGLPRSIEEDIMKCKDVYAVRRVMLAGDPE